MMADQSGYCLKFDIYTGKSGDGIERNLGARVVKELCTGLEHKGHHVYFDNYFNSVYLMEDLKQKGIYACGTVNITRQNMPTFVTDKQMKRGEFDYWINKSGVLVAKWKDKRSVHLLSNYHRSHETGVVKRKNKNRIVEIVPCPQMLIDYNQHMNAVDKFDQMKSTYEINRATNGGIEYFFIYWMHLS